MLSSTPPPPERKHERPRSVFFGGGGGSNCEGGCSCVKELEYLEQPMKSYVLGSGFDMALKRLDK